MGNSSLPGPFNHILVHSTAGKSNRIPPTGIREHLVLPKKQPAPPSWIYWECWEWVEAPARWWLMFTEDFVTSSPCDSSGSSRPSNWLHSLFQSHPRNSFSFRNSHSWRRTFPGRAWSPRKGSGQSPSCPLIGARWGHLGTPIPSAPPDSRGSNPPGDSSRSK